MSTPLSREALEILSEASLDSNSVKLNCGILEDRALYDEVNEALVRVGGKWKGNKKRHVFGFDPAEAVQRLIESGEMPPKNPLDYFPTPDEVIDGMLSDTETSDYIAYLVAMGGRVLEPSVGRGAIAMKLVERGLKKEQIQCVEMDGFNADIVRAKGFNVIEDDFLNYQPEEKFNLIVMNPPFAYKGNKRLYADHIQHAFGMLRQGGLLVAIAPNSLFVSIDAKNAALIDLVGQNCGTIEGHEAEAFKESGTTVGTLTIYVRNDGLEWLDGDYDGFTNKHSFGVAMQAHNESRYFSTIKHLRKQMKLDGKGQPDAETREEIIAFYRQVYTAQRAEGVPNFMRDKDYDCLVEHFVGLAIEEMGYETPATVTAAAVEEDEEDAVSMADDLAILDQAIETAETITATLQKIAKNSGAPAVYVEPEFAGAQGLLQLA